MRGDLGGSVGGGGGSSAGDTWPETSSSFCESRAEALDLKPTSEGRGRDLTTARPEGQPDSNSNSNSNGVQQQ